LDVFNMEAYSALVNVVFTRQTIIWDLPEPAMRPGNCRYDSNFADSASQKV